MGLKIKDIIIIGAGPAGIATAIQLRRYGLEPLIIEKSHIGGLLRNANLVENYPGFPHGISGPDLVKLFQTQLQNSGIRVNFGEVEHLDYDGRFAVKTRNELFHSQIVVVASGTKPLTYSGVFTPEEARNRIHYEIDSIRNVMGKTIAIIGAGDAAFDYALNLSPKNEIILFNRGVKTKCLPLLWERAHKMPQISYHNNVVISGINCTDNGFFLACQGRLKKWELFVDYVIFAIGRKEQLDFIPDKLMFRPIELEKSGLLFFVGDVHNALFRQTSIAVGDGVKVAMSIYQGTLE